MLRGAAFHAGAAFQAAQAGKPAMDVQIITKAITDAKELISGVMTELKSSASPGADTGARP